MAGPYRLVIFDFDGTLADSLPWFASVIDETARRFGFRRVREDEVARLRDSDSAAVLASLGISRWKLLRVTLHLRRRFGREWRQVPLFPGTRPMLEALRAGGLRLALVSSNAEANVRRVLGPEIAALFERIECGASTFGKATKFRRTLRRLGVAPADAMAVGDEARDVAAAREAGIASGAVEWGYAAPGLLARQNPTMQFATMADLVARLCPAA